MCGTATDGIFNAARELIKHMRELNENEAETVSIVKETKRGFVEDNEDDEESAQSE